MPYGHNDRLIFPETCEESLYQNGFEDYQESCTKVVVLAGKHITAAQVQKRLAQPKGNTGNISIDEYLSNESVTLLKDFCQSLDLTHLDGKQSGDTYYDLPILI